MCQLSLFAAIAALLLGIPLGVSSVGVREVEFTRLDSGSRSGDWLELDVRRDASDATRVNPDFIDDLEISVMLGFERGGSARDGFDFFRSKAELVSLKEGRHFVRFYLPPEIVERNQVRSEPHSFLIRLARSGRVVSESVSRQLERPQVRDSFLARIDAKAARNDGVLLPQFKSPFYLSYPRETPTFRDSDLPLTTQ